MKKQKKELEKIEAINVTISVERLAGWTKEDLIARLTEELNRVGEGLGSDNGPRFNIEAGPNTIVELNDKDPFWRAIDVEPIDRRPKTKLDFGKWKRRETTTRGADPTTIVEWSNGVYKIQEFQNVYRVFTEMGGHACTDMQVTGERQHKKLEAKWFKQEMEG